MNERKPETETDQAILLRALQRGDGALLHDLVAACPPLDLNSRYAYLLLSEHHATTSVAATIDGTLVGAITAYVPPQQANTLFVWQVAVSPQMRGQKLGTRMLEYLLQQCIQAKGLEWMETTISPDNPASQQLFTQFAVRHDVGCTITTLFDADEFGESGHQAECLYKIGPWGRVA